MQFQAIVQNLDTLAQDNSLVSQPNLNPQITGIAAINQATSDTLSYIEGGKLASAIANTKAAALILPPDKTLQTQAAARNIAWIASPQPRLLFAKAIALFYQPFSPAPDIHNTAIIDPKAEIGKDVYIGANVVIYSGVKLGDRVAVYPNVVIYPDVAIGDNTILHANCTIHERSQIGANCVIHSGAVIGAEGFGFVPTESGWCKMEQSGYTVLEDAVEIGCNSAVDRPAVGETRIGRNTKVDNLVQIGHGCQVGQNCAFAGQVGLAGGAMIGNRVLLGGQSGVANQITVGDGAIATAQTAVIQDVPAGEMVSGTPNLPSPLYRRLFVIYKKLPEIYQMYKEWKKEGLSDKLQQFSDE
ncbi:MAG: UDP-3-O-(3-hydroxymyristoyl)glucosamine N-acyltransferase [Pleurocapsa sp.]